ncbi:UbiA family prenyltransferase [Amycolatopsis sp. K13G38]|uniref:UbiA family prenyltransferase n=1 Tax=Amycolatopsis acididurans TaxID=2724524 RepID=A0ABX1IZ29_9PSEU|nr:UbiA family prenyltransferase [Amycolatopsis acididurans]NKQ52761.1 UbiA family prenyltransferase [Amycolatopsis acididurans]
MLFAGNGAARLLTAPAILAIAANLLLIVAPLALNVAVDHATDSQHADKRYLAGAAGRFGRSRALDWAGAELILAALALLATGLGWGRWQPLSWAALIVVAQLLYNVEPVRLKRRGFAGSVAFGVASVGLPCLVGYTAVAPHITADVWLIAAGVAVLSVARTVWWALPDQAADTASGIATPTVRYGLVRTHLAACALLVTGLMLLGWGLGRRYGPAGAALGLAAHVVFLGIAAAQLPATAAGNPPTARSMLKRTMPVVALGEVLIAAVALMF